MSNAKQRFAVCAAAVAAAVSLGSIPACSVESDDSAESDQGVSIAVQVSNDATNVYYKIPYSGTPDWVRVYLDTDRNASTDFPFNGIGARYLIENGRLHRYSGVGGRWGWTYIKNVTYQLGNGVATLAVARADIGSPAGIDLITQTAYPAATSQKITQILSDTGTAPVPAPATDAGTPSPSGGQVTYAPTTAAIFNPERGWYHQITCNNSLSASWLQGYRAQGNSLVLCYFNIGAFVSSPISQTFLTLIDSQMGLIRTAGLKAVVRFAYNQDSSAVDATPTQVLAHMDQLAPVLSKNEDVLAVMEAGFIGSWGEGDASQHFGNTGQLSSQNWADRKAVADKEMQITPLSRMVTLHMPLEKMTFNGSTPISSSEAFNGSNKSRRGHSDDCFLSTPTDWGTYTNVSVEYPYLAADSAYSPMGGETCKLNPPRSDCPTALNEMAMFHWSFLHDGYNLSVLDSWKTQGCYSEVQKRLGYRFVLQSGTFSSSGKPGGAFAVSFTLNNEGFASPYNKRDLELVLRNQTSGATYRVKLAADPRFWLPGAPITVSETVTLPADLPSGTYALLLNLPDPMPSLRNRPEYSIQLANDKVWEGSTGFNDLHVTTTIAP